MFCHYTRGRLAQSIRGQPIFCQNVDGMCIERRRLQRTGVEGLEVGAASNDPRTLPADFARRELPTFGREEELLTRRCEVAGRSICEPHW